MRDTADLASRQPMRLKSLLGRESLAAPRVMAQMDVLPMECYRVGFL